MADHPPVVLVFAGNDPSGGAGIAADIQALAANGCYPAPVVTALTVQDTTGVARVDAVEPELVEQQARTVLNDLPVAAIKTGLLASAAIVSVVAQLAREFSLPVIVDPVLKSGGGKVMTDTGIVDAYLDQLLPLAVLATPNTLEADALDRDRVLASGCQWLLITGGHEDGKMINHQLFHKDGLEKVFEQPRLPGEYHGSGCTLASACAAGLARGLPVEQAVTEALHYTRQTLETAFALGKGQQLPNRLPNRLPTQ